MARMRLEYGDPEEDAMRGSEGHDTAQVCPNGHVATMSFHDHPQFRNKHCPKCGEATTTTCVHCSAEIEGSYRGSFSTHFEPPDYCKNCGKPFPWTEKRLQAAQQLAELEAIDPKEIETLKQDLATITTDTPFTPVAAARLRRIWSRISAPLQRIAMDMASEAAKRLLFPK